MRLMIKRAALLLLLAAGFPASSGAGLVVSQWYFGSWDCRIDGRPSRMRWGVADDPQTQCAGGICTTTSGVRVYGRFSDNGSAWVPLKVQAANNHELRIRYLGGEPDNWYLRRDPASATARGWTTWRGNRYPLECRKVR